MICAMIAMIGIEMIVLSINMISSLQKFAGILEMMISVAISVR